MPDEPLEDKSLGSWLVDSVIGQGFSLTAIAGAITAGLFASGPSIAAEIQSVVYAVLASLGAWAAELLENYGVDPSSLQEHVADAKQHIAMLADYVEALRSGGLSIGAAFTLLAGGFVTAMFIRGARWVLGFIPTLHLS